MPINSSGNDARDPISPYGGGQRGLRMRTMLLSIALWERGRVKIRTAYSTALTSCRFSQSLHTDRSYLSRFFYDFHSQACRGVSLFLSFFSSAFLSGGCGRLKRTTALVDVCHLLRQLSQLSASHWRPLFKVNAVGKLLLIS